jgi:hypothetical protein
LKIALKSNNEVLKFHIFVLDRKTFFRQNSENAKNSGEKLQIPALINFPFDLGLKLKRGLATLTFTGISLLSPEINSGIIVTSDLSERNEISVSRKVSPFPYGKFVVNK